MAWWNYEVWNIYNDTTQDSQGQSDDGDDDEVEDEEEGLCPPFPYSFITYIVWLKVQ